MYKITLKDITRQYKNNGCHIEQKVRYTLTGKIVKADNISHKIAGDCGIYQIKTARATICKGSSDFATDFNKYLAECAEKAFIYGTEQTAYIMTIKEFTDFVMMFHTIDRDSRKNGGGLKYRLKNNKQMIEYLESLC